MRADLSLYRVFVAVADEGSFVRAAAKLYLTQPAVSQAVRRMEAQTGAKLFLRGRRGVRLTREGELLYRHASAALAMLEAGEISKEYYDKWRYHYPEFDKTKCWAKVPSQELCNLPVQDV